MKTIHTFTIGFLVIAGLFFSSAVSAMPGHAEAAQRKSIELCVAQIGGQANYEEAGRVLHDVNSRERRVGGHVMRIKTFVYATDGEQLVREYATTCAVARNSEIRLFKIRQKTDEA